MSEETATIPVEIPEETQRILLGDYLKNILSKPSLEMWDELTSTDEIDMDAVYAAAGKAVLNEAMVDSILKGMKIEMEQRKIKGNNNE